MSNEGPRLSEPTGPTLLNILDVLPTEVIITIFDYCLPSHEFPKPTPTTAPLLLSRVCSSWRRFVNSCPTLWRSFGFVFRFKDDDAEKTTVKNLLGLWNANSNCRLQELSVSLGSHPVRSQAWSDVLKDCLLPNASSLRLLRLNGNVGCTDLLRILPDSLPALEVLRWLNAPPDVFNPIEYGSITVCTVPKIHSLMLTNTALDMQRCRMSFSWKDLRRLILPHNQTRTTFYTLLEECKSLEYLSITVGDGIYDTNGAKRSIVATRLEEFKVIFAPATIRADPSFFHGITFPVLTSFRLCNSPQESSPKFSFNAYTLSPVFPFDGLRHLRCLTLGYHDLNAERVVKILRLTPFVVDLRIDSQLGRYDTLFEALASSDRPLAPSLEYLELYVQLFATPIVEFSNHAFFNMIQSRIRMTPQCLGRVIVYVQNNGDSRVDVPSLVGQQQRLELGGVDVHFLASNDLTLWLVEPDEEDDDD